MCVNHLAGGGQRERVSGEGERERRKEKGERGGKRERTGRRDNAVDRKRKRAHTHTETFFRSPKKNTFGNPSTLYAVMNGMLLSLSGCELSNLFGQVLCFLSDLWTRGGERLRALEPSPRQTLEFGANSLNDVVY